VAEGSVEVGPLDPEVHRPPECLERVTKVAQPAKAILQIEEPRLVAHRLVPLPVKQRESDRAGNREVLGTVQLRRL
jgi:hypothetical protein